MKKSTQAKAIAHYDRMIAWAKKQHCSGLPDRDRMYNEINEHWYSDSCAYCNHYERDCYKCSLLTIDKEGEEDCCNGL
jgi:hypothetical protein